MPVGLRSDWRAWESKERVNLTSYRNDGSMVAGTVTAKRRNLTLKEKQQSAGAYQAAGLVWFVPDDLLDASFGDLKPRDLVEDADGNVYTVQDVDKICLASVWRLTTLDLSIVYDLGDTINIERAVYADDAAGSPVKQFPTGPAPNGGSVLYSTLLAKCHPEQAAEDEQRGIQGQTVRYTVYLSRPAPDVTTEDRVAWPQPDLTIRYLEIRGWHNADRIDELFTLDCELVP